jgi:hypothetical protein
MPLAAATRIVSLEHQLAAAHRRITHLEQTTGQSSADASDRYADDPLTPQCRRSAGVSRHACLP